MSERELVYKTYLPLLEAKAAIEAERAGKASYPLIRSHFDACRIAHKRDRAWR